MLSIKYEGSWGLFTIVLVGFLALVTWMVTKVCHDTEVGQFPKKIRLTKALRNNEGNVKLVKEYINVSNVRSNISNFVRLLNDTSKIGELEISSNLTRTFPTENFLLKANNYQDGFEKVFEALKGIDDTCNTSAVIVIPWTLTSNTNYCMCYGKYSLQELMTILSPIYKNFNRPEPIVYLEMEHVDQTRTWVTNSNKANDLITSHYLVNGFEHPIVVIFNEEGTFGHNLAMRSTGIVVVVNIPYNPWSKICFHPS